MIFSLSKHLFNSYYTEADLGLLLEAVNYYHKVLHLGCCSSPRSASVMAVLLFISLFCIASKVINLKWFNTLMEVEYFTSKRKWVMTNLKNTTVSLRYALLVVSQFFLTVKDIFRMNIFYDEILSSKKSLIWNCLLVLIIVSLFGICWNKSQLIKSKTNECRKEPVLKIQKFLKQ